MPKKTVKMHNGIVGLIGAHVPDLVNFVDVTEKGL